MSSKLQRQDLFSLEKYAELRPDFRKEVMEHKQNRQVAIGPHATLYFEDRLTIHYQIQEMLRAERIFEANAIQEELDTYNALISDGNNWKATFMLEYTDIEQRKQALSQLIGIEDHVWVQVDGFDRVYAIADEDMERTTDDKTSAVHFLRFELTNDMVNKVINGSDVAMGIDHDHYSYENNPIEKPVCQSLSQDLGKQ